MESNMLRSTTQVRAPSQTWSRQSDTNDLRVFPILCRQVFGRRGHGGEFRESAGRWLAEECADESGGDGRLVGDVIGCFLGLHVAVHRRTRKVRASKECRNRSAIFPFQVSASIARPLMSSFNSRVEGETTIGTL